MTHKDYGAEFEEYVRHFRQSTLEKMMESAFVMQLVPKEDEFDVKFATELGASIMLDKPIMAVVMPGATVSKKLLAVADMVVEADIDTDEGRKELARRLSEFTEHLP